MSFHTVAFHIQNIYAKLQVHSKSQAVAKALRHHLIPDAFLNRWWGQEESSTCCIPGCNRAKRGWG